MVLSGDRASGGTSLADRSVVYWRALNDSVALTLNDIPLVTIDGETTSLAQYADKVKLIVNVASRCGLTPQYTKLEELQKTYGDRGFTVLGFPSNQFLQELSSSEAIKDFCSEKYAVTFPMFEKIKVNGRSQHPLSSRADQDSRCPRQGRQGEVELREVRGHTRRRGAPFPSDR